jgi:hypothetical protein
MCCNGLPKRGEHDGAGDPVVRGHTECVAGAVVEPGLDLAVWAGAAVEAAESVVGEVGLPGLVGHGVLPMSYAVDGLRQLMYGGLSTLVLRDVLVLLAWLAVALVATSRVARVQRIWTVQRVKPELAI